MLKFDSSRACLITEVNCILQKHNLNPSLLKRQTNTASHKINATADTGTHGRAELVAGSAGCLQQLQVGFHQKLPVCVWEHERAFQLWGSGPALQIGLAWRVTAGGKVQKVCMAMINLHAAGARRQSQATFRAENYEPCAVGHHVAWLNIITHSGNNSSSH